MGAHNLTRKDYNGIEWSITTGNIEAEKETHVSGCMAACSRTCGEWNVHGFYIKSSVNRVNSTELQIYIFCYIFYVYLV